jgi:DNA invertase Pin-like site-specific DNA recombinase
MESKNNIVSFESFAKGSIKNTSIGNKCVIYTRVSTKDQADNNMSLVTQKNLCEKFCQKNGYEIIECFGGTYESAKNDERKEFNRMLTFIKKSKEKISQIVVYSIDRFSRSGANAIYIKEQLKKSGVTIQSVSQPTDTTTSSGRLQQNIHFVFSDFDNELRRDKCVTGMRESLLRGDWCVHAPIGYDHIKQNGKRMIVLNETGKKLKNVFVWKAKEGITHVEIKTRLEKLGVKLPIQRISALIKNPFYCGLLVHNLLEGKVIEGNHEKLVSKELFLQANEVKNGNTGGYKVFIPNDEIPLKHFLKCEKCGTYMRAYKATKNQKYYYKCGTTGCKINMRSESVHLEFKKELEKYSVSINESMKGIITKYMEHTYSQIHKNSDEEKLILEKQIKEIEKKVERIEEKFLNDEIQKDLFDKHIDKCKEEKKELFQKLSLLPNKSSNLEKCIENAIKLSSKLNTAWDLADYTNKQKLQYLLFPEGMFYNKENNTCRTQRVNSIFSAIAELSRVSKEYKKDNLGRISRLSRCVVPPGIEPGSRV